MKSLRLKNIKLELKQLATSTMANYDGMPKMIVKKASSGQELDERLSYARSKWMAKNGDVFLQIDVMQSADIRNLFKFIDFNNAGIVSKHQIKLSLQFFRSEFSDHYHSKSPLILALRGLCTIPNQKVFSEDSFVYFYQKVRLSPEQTSTFFNTRKQLAQSTGFKELAKRRELDGLFEKGAHTVQNSLQSVPKSKEPQIVSQLKVKLKNTLMLVAELKTYAQLGGAAVSTQ